MALLRFPYVLTLLSVILCLQTTAQNSIFLSEGKIEFEKKDNLFARMDPDHNWPEELRKTIPQFKTTYFDLVFTRNRSLYKPGRENTENTKLWEQPGEENVVYSELDNAKSISQKKVFEQLFLVQDSIRKISWKITDETRTIAGFNCRRANAVILDSIYVVAFYTDEILTSGGPESFTGLPGMILGIALPHQHLTWFATKVQAIKVGDAELAAPQKGKKLTNSAFKQALESSMKQWGTQGQGYIQAALL
jgi:GLPGLI family protein